MKKKILLIAVGILVAAAIGGISYAYARYNSMQDAVEKDTIYKGIYIDDLHIGGLTKGKALNIFRRLEKTDKEKELKIFLNDKIQYTRTYDEFGYKTNYQELIERASQIARDGSLKERYHEITLLEEQPRIFALERTFNEQNVNDFMDSIKNDFSLVPKNAIIQRINGKFVIEEETIGYELHEEESKKQIFQALESGHTEVQLKVVEKKPQYTKAYYENINSLIGSCYTEFSNTQPMRNENLRVASNKVNGTLIHPGEIFSTNKTIDVSTENGYQAAPIIVNGKLQPGVGGGVCQIATTLYNAVLYAELEVVERKNHSMPVGYIAKGKDATLAGDYIDFKFRNNMDYPVYIESYIEDNKLYMNIYGKEIRASNRKIVLNSSIINTIPQPAQKVIIDPTLKPGERIVEKKGRTGYNVELYKLIYVNDELVKTELVNTSYYQPVGAEVRVGEIKEEQLKTTLNIKDKEKQEDNQPEESNQSEQPVEDTLDVESSLEVQQNEEIELKENEEIEVIE